MYSISKNKEEKSNTPSEWTMKSYGNNHNNYSRNLTMILNKDLACIIASINIAFAHTCIR